MPANHTLAVEIDTLLQATYTPHEPGAAVIGTKGGETDQPRAALVPFSEGVWKILSRHYSGHRPTSMRTRIL